jgi:hypothetical protein
MSPNAYALTLAASTLARQPAPERIPQLQAIQRHCAETLLDTRAPWPAAWHHNPTEGDPIQVLWAKAGTPGEVGEVWCHGTFLRAVGHGADKQFLVSSTTPRSAGTLVRTVAPQSVRFMPTAPTTAGAAA